MVPSSPSLSANEPWVTNTSAPPAGAGALNVTVPVAEAKPATLVGATVTAASTGPVGGGVTFNLVNCMLPPNEPVMLTAVGAVTERVVTGNVTATASAGTVTLAGTVTAGESAESVTTAPPGGAAAFKNTVPVAELPPTKLVV